MTPETPVETTVETVSRLYPASDQAFSLVSPPRLIAEENRKDIIARLWKGRQERVRRGSPPGGNVPYGFRRNGKGLTFDPMEAEVVKMIFELAAGGETRSAIARMLNEKALQRRNGSAWTQRQVSAILARQALYRAGVIRYGEVAGANRALILLGEQECPI